MTVSKARIDVENGARNPSPRNSGTMLRDWVLKIGSAMVGRRFTSALDEMQRAQWLPGNVLQERTESRLSRLLRHAAENVPFYREAYRRLDLALTQVQTVSDLQHLPIVSKATFRQHPIEQFLATNIPAHRQLEWTTSGSTGEPFKFYLDRQMMPIVFASHLFYDTWFSLNPFDRHIRIMAPPAAEPPLPENTPWTTWLRYKVNSRLQAAYEAKTQRRFSMFDLSGARAEEIYDCIETFRPRYVLGYTSTLSSVADDLLRRNLLLSRPLSGVMTIAETLTPHRRQLIEQYFGGPIINRYGLREFKFWCAQNCSESPNMFHVNTELVVWEIVRQDGTPAPAGELGRVVLTNLHNYAMPFIRYDTGDLAVAGAQSCVCGRGFPLVEQLEGRSTECVWTPSGKMINPVSLGQYLFVSHDYVDAIRQYQLVVKRPNEMTLLVVPSGVLAEETSARLQRHMAELVGEEVTIEVEVVEEIPLEKSGKRPIIKSNRGAS